MQQMKNACACTQPTRLGAFESTPWSKRAERIQEEELSAGDANQERRKEEGLLVDNCEVEEDIAHTRDTEEAVALSLRDAKQHTDCIEAELCFPCVCSAEKHLQMQPACNETAFSASAAAEFFLCCCCWCWCPGFCSYCGS